MQYPKQTACYDCFELVLPGPQSGNPFIEISFEAHFQNKKRVLNSKGFYDGEGTYKVRIMPDEPGEWSFTTISENPELNGKTGQFSCLPARDNIHGPVHVAEQFHFAYADGSLFLPVGTTCYAWIHQKDELERQTLESLRLSPFNKIRMCVFPKHYRYNQNEPDHFAFQKDASGSWDFTHFNPAFFHHLEQRIVQLGELGIEADLILFHPYDRWGFSDMTSEVDDRYLNYITARLSAFRNVWWSLANEYDLMRNKKMEDWDRFFQILQNADPHNHLRSIHNWQGLDTHDQRTFYDHSKPWVTHCSVQHSHIDRLTEWREMYRKPVVIDECCYEGSLPNGWGNITGQEMARRFWESAIRGGYGGHGETFLDPNDVIWWSKGGTLKGESPQRIAFMRQILESLPGPLDPLGRITDTHLSSAGRRGEYALTYFGFRQPEQITITIDWEGTYQAEVIDTWDMTITRIPGSFKKTCTLVLPARPYMAVLVRHLK